YMAMSDINRRRTKPLEAETVDRLAREYQLYSAQYPIFAEAPTLKDSTIMAFLDAAEHIGKMRDQSLRADAAGRMQSLTGLWQIFCRQGSIAAAESDGTLSGILNPFLTTSNSRDLFDAGRNGVKTLLTATKSAADANPQDRMIDLLAGASSFTDEDA